MEQAYRTVIRFMLLIAGDTTYILCNKTVAKVFVCKIKGHRVYVLLILNVMETVMQFCGGVF